MEALTLAAVGDLMPAGLLSQHFERYGNSQWPSSIRNTLQQADIRFGNLECPLYRTGTPIDEHKTLLYAKDDTIGVVEKAGLDVVSLANNHSMDFGWNSLHKTMMLLKKRKIRFVGAGMNISEARRPALLSVKGTSIAFLGYTRIFDKVSPAALNDKPGLAPFEMQYVYEDIEQLKTQSDRIVVSIHWGEEYIQYPCPEQIDKAKQIIDWGADVVLGHHSHVVQGTLVYKGKPIYFSLGNFLFSQYYATNGGRRINYDNLGELSRMRRASRIGMIAEVDLNCTDNNRIVPILLNKKAPVFEDISDCKQETKALAAMTNLSKPLSSNNYRDFYGKALFWFKVLDLTLLRPLILLETYGLKHLVRKIIHRVMNRE